MNYWVNRMIDEDIYPDHYLQLDNRSLPLDSPASVYLHKVETCTFVLSLRSQHFFATANLK